MTPIEAQCKIHDEGIKWNDPRHAELETIMTLGWEELEARHPKIFSGKNIGCYVSPGWWKLLEAALIRIEAVLDEQPALKFNAVQIKEKFGSLRFYYDISKVLSHRINDENLEDDRVEISNVVHDAEVASYTTCEICGEPGEQRNLRNTDWIRTLCDKHYHPKIKD